VAPEVEGFDKTKLGYGLDEIPYIKIAEKIGVGSANLDKANIIELNKDNSVEKITPGKIDHLTKHIQAEEACSACYGSLVHALKRLDDKNMLNNLNQKIHIGQGYKNKT